jgi:hypothetical protein
MTSFGQSMTDAITPKYSATGKIGYCTNRNRQNPGGPRRCTITQRANAVQVSAAQNKSGATKGKNDEITQSSTDGILRGSSGQRNIFTRGKRRRLDSQNHRYV